MKHQRKSQVSSGGREPGFALLLAGVLANGLREWQKNDIARRVELGGSNNKTDAGCNSSGLVQCEDVIRDYK
jgi:hypothetical protein